MTDEPLKPTETAVMPVVVQSTDPLVVLPAAVSPSPVHGAQWTLLIVVLSMMAASAYSLIEPLKQWSSYEVIYTPQGASDVMRAVFFGLAAALLALGVNPKPILTKIAGMLA